MRHTEVGLAVMLGVLSGCLSVSRPPANATSAAGSQALADARVALAELRYDRARSALAVALTLGGHDRKTLAEIYRLSGEVEAALGHPSKAEAHFQRLLVLAPDTTMGEGVSPKIANPFKAAQQWTQGRAALDATCAVNGSVVSITVENDPLQMAQSVRISPRDDRGNEVGAPAVAARPFDIGIPQEARSFTAVVLDRNGNLLVELGTPDAPVVVAPDGSANTWAVTAPYRDGAVGAERPLYTRWWPWAAGSALALTTGVLFAVRVGDREGELRALNNSSQTMPVPASAVIAIRNRAERDAIIADIAFGAAIASAIVGAVLTVRYERSRAAHAQPVIGPNGAGVRVAF